MKEHYRRLVALVVFVMALNAAALAQDFGPKVRAQIPFNFYAGGKAMPAGNYTFAINRQNHTIAISQYGQGIGAFLLGSPHDSSNNGLTKLTFRTNDEDVYVLQNLEGPDFGLSFKAGKAVSSVAQDNPATATQVVLAQLVK